MVAIALMVSSLPAAAQQVLTLDSCRAWAIRNNKELQMTALKQEAAHWQHKSAFTHYFPRINAVGTYQYSSREISLLNDEQKDKLSHLGTNISNAATQGLTNGLQQGAAALQQRYNAFLQSPEFAQLLQNPMVQQILAQNPQLMQTLANPQLIQQMAEPAIQQAATAFNGLLSNMAGMLDAEGQSIVDAFRTDTRNLMGATVMLTQPLYMGGKIMAYDKITRLAEQAAGHQYSIEEQDLLVKVDEAYWRIIALQSKKKLAESFLSTVQKLDSDVEKVIAEGMATKADGLSVKVKLNEAEVSVIQVDNGLTLSRMALAQICGLPLDAEFLLQEELQGDGMPQGASSDPNLLNANIDDENAVDIAMQSRPELKALGIAAQVKDQQVKVARSEYMPNLALTAGYLLSNPSIYNGFEKKFGGMWTVGVVLKVPIITAGDRIFKVRQAKAEAAIAHTRAEEVREKITLQVNQNRQKLQEAQHRLAAAQRSQDQADENLRMANLGMREGVIPVSNVLQAQTAWLAAHSTLVDAEIDVRLAALYMQRAKGVLR